MGKLVVASKTLQPDLKFIGVVAVRVKSTAVTLAISESSDEHYLSSGFAVTAE